MNFALAKKRQCRMIMDRKLSHYVDKELLVEFRETQFLDTTGLAKPRARRHCWESYEDKQGFDHNSL